MYDTLMKYKNCKKFDDYEESINTPESLQVRKFLYVI